MYIPDFEYYRPPTVEEACHLLARFGEGAKVLAGGTDLLPKMKNDLIAPKVLVSLKSIRQIRQISHASGRGVVIGAGVTHNGLMNSALLQERYPSIPEAAHAMANNQVRNLGTVGGNLVSAVPSADLPPILVTLNASLTLTSARGKRTMPLADFFVGPQRSAILADEVLEEITIPDQPTTGSAYIKFGLRRSGALAVVGVAASVVAEGRWIKEARIVLGAVAPTPIRARNAEKLLAGVEATEEILEEAGRAAALECKPISDIRGSEEYRRDMIRVFTKRALRKALHMAENQGEGGYTQ